MKTSALAPVFLVMASWSQGADSTPPALAAPPAEASDSSGANASSGGRPHAVSPSTAAKLSAGLPKFSPPKSAATASVADESSETDKPRNGIIRLPRYEVRDRKIPEFREREMLTPEGKLELALKRHPGLNLGPLAFLNHKVGLAMLEEERQVERNAEMSDLTDFLQFADSVHEAVPPATTATATKK